MKVGNWIREYRGIYRLALFPMAEHPDLVKWALWSRNRNEAPEGVYSHRTALSLYELSDLNPAKLHMTVPAHFRRNSEIPGILGLHYADLATLRRKNPSRIFDRAKQHPRASLFASTD